jgi:hypothetical protein
MLHVPWQFVAVLLSGAQEGAGIGIDLLSEAMRSHIEVEYGPFAALV